MEKFVYQQLEEKSFLIKSGCKKCIYRYKSGYKKCTKALIVAIIFVFLQSKKTNTYYV